MSTLILLVFICCLSFLHSLLGEILAVLKTQASKNMFDRFVNRASRLGNLEKYDRLINDFNTDFVACFLPLFDYSGSFQIQTDLHIQSHWHLTNMSQRTVLPSAASE